MYKKERISCYQALFASLLAFIVGEYLLNSVAPMEDPPLGPTFHIVLGCALMIVGLLSIILLIRHLMHLRRKERRRKRNPVNFLKDKKATSET